MPCKVTPVITLNYLSRPYMEENHFGSVLSNQPKIQLISLKLVNTIIKSKTLWKELLKNQNIHPVPNRLNLDILHLKVIAR